MPEKTKVAAIVTFGCRLNTADTGLLTDRLTAAGYRVIELAAGCDAPDLVILNSCAVTAEAEHKSRREARRLRERFGRRDSPFRIRRAGSRGSRNRA